MHRFLVAGSVLLLLACHPFQDLEDHPFQAPRDDTADVQTEDVTPEDIADATLDAGPDLGDNTPPRVAILEPPFDVVVNTPVALIGSFEDPDEGDTHTVSWRQVSGTPLELGRTDTLNISFTVPKPSGRSLVLEIEVCDQLAACGRAEVALYVISTELEAVYAAPFGAADGDGSRESPLSSVSAALEIANERAQVEQAPFEVRLANGTFQEEATLIVLDGVDVLGGFSESWVRDRTTSTTRIVVEADVGMIIPDDGVLGTGVALSGLGLALSPHSDASEGERTTLSLLGRTVVLEHLAVEVPTASSIARGVAVGAAASVSGRVVNISGGDVDAPAGFVSGLYTEANLELTRLVVNLSAPRLRNRSAVISAGAEINLTRSRLVLETPIDPGQVEGVEGTAGITALEAARVVLVDTEIQDGGGGPASLGVQLGEGAQLLAQSSTIVAGPAVGTAQTEVVSAAVLANLASSVEITGASVLEGGSVSPIRASSPEILHLSAGFLGVRAVAVELRDSSASAGSQANGAAVACVGCETLVIAHSTLNEGPSGDACQGGSVCFGLLIDGTTRQIPLKLGPAPQRGNGFSCCDPDFHDVIIEDSTLFGGKAQSSKGAFVGVNNGTLSTNNPAVCINASHIDAGDCPLNSGTGGVACVGLESSDTRNLTLHNTVVYGGTGAVTQSLNVTPSGTTNIANNYLHGGDPVGDTSQSTALRLGAGGVTARARIANNIIDTGTGARAFGIYEENLASDPAYVVSNNFVYANRDGGLYRNCLPTGACGVLKSVALMEEAITGSAQVTKVAANNTDNHACLVNPAPRDGDYRQSGASKCLDAGFDANPPDACQLCATPWVGAEGTQRSKDAYVRSGLSCAIDSSVELTGDGKPDIGPSEAP